MIWSFYVQLSYNAYSDRPRADHEPDNPLPDDLVASPVLRWDQTLWEELTRELVDAGANQVVLSLGDGIRYASHPEIAVDGAWTPSELRRELTRLRALGLDVVPELNFSTAHDIWLRPYDRMVSTPRYYEVCADLIAEIIDLFDMPQMFHLGFDEETLEQQRDYYYVALRQHDLWWHDLLWFVEQVQARGVRPWVWADAIWRDPSGYRRRMPRAVVQSNWYYARDFDQSDPQPGHGATGLTGRLSGYRELANGGYDQLLTGSNFLHDANFPETVRFAQRCLSKRTVLGFVQTTWRPIVPRYRDAQRRGVAALAEGIRAYDPAGWADQEPRSNDAESSRQCGSIASYGK